MTSAGLELERETIMILAESPIEVRLRVKDVDGLDIKFTRADISSLGRCERA